MSNYLIVGGTKGIGLALTQKLVNEGEAVTVWARTPSVITGAEVYTHDLTCDAPDIGTLPDDFLQDFQVNLLGVVKTLQITQPLLKKSPQASVVLFSTVAVGTGMPYHASVASSKGAVEGLVKSLAAEWAPGIRVNAIAPSLTATSLAEKLISSPEKRTAAGRRHPLQKIGEPEDIAAMAAFLLSSAACWTTRQVLHIDGGLSAIKL